MRPEGWLALAAVFAGGCTTIILAPSDMAGAPDMAAADLAGADLTGTTAGDEFTFTMTSFPVAAGEEVFRCQNFANPVGAEIEVGEWESHMTAGSHHLLVFYQPNATDGPNTACSGLEFKAGPYGAQTPDAKITYPTGVAAVLPANRGLRLAVHYLNATPQPIQAHVSLTMRRKQGAVTDRAGVFFFNNIAIALSANTSPQTISKTCTISQDMNILFSTGHMHQRGTNLTAKLGGTTIYSTDSWSNSPFLEHLPPVHVTAGQQITFSCTYVNQTGGPIFFGESAETSEMCIYDGQYYPDPGGQGMDCD